MSIKNFRNGVNTAVVQWMASAFPDVPTYVENQDMPDEESMADFWADVHLRFYSANTISIEARPVIRHIGVVAINVYYKPGKGTAEVDDIMDGLKELLRNRHLAGGTLKAPGPGIGTTVLGWEKTPLSVPFMFDEF